MQEKNREVEQKSRELADLHVHAVCVAHVCRVLRDRLLHPERGVAGADGVILMRQRRARTAP